MISLPTICIVMESGARVFDEILWGLRGLASAKGFGSTFLSFLFFSFWGNWMRTKTPCMVVMESRGSNSFHYRSMVLRMSRTDNNSWGWARLECWVVRDWASAEDY